MVRGAVGVHIIGVRRTVVPVRVVRVVAATDEQVLKAALLAVHLDPRHRLEDLLLRQPAAAARLAAIAAARAPERPPPHEVDFDRAVRVLVVLGDGTLHPVAQPVGVEQAAELRARRVVRLDP